LGRRVNHFPSRLEQPKRKPGTHSTEKPTIKDGEMGDKGGKKDKDKSKKQQSAKQAQKSQGKADRNKPKGA
jgi:hypothetical protein